MKNKFSLYVPSFLIFLFSLISAQPALAHGGDPRIEIGAERLNPGAALDVRGVDFEFEEQVVLDLSGSQLEIPLGSAVADAEGVFQLTITLPEDLAEGTYTIRAKTDDHVVESPQITVWGTADPLGSNTDRLDEDAGYGLLAPMPTPVVGAATAEPPKAVPVKIESPQRPANVFVWIAAGLAVIILSGFAFKMRR